MIRLSELFDLLASGELSNLYLADGGNGELKPEKRALVLRSINAGLTDLFTRFVLKKKQLEVYPVLHSVSVVSDDLVEILAIKHGEHILEPHIDYKLTAVNELVLKGLEPYVLSHLPLVIEYQAKHRTLTQEDINNDSYVELPLSYVNALMYFIGSRLFTSIVNQLDGDLNESTRYLQKYQNEIMMLTNQGVDVDSSLHHDWFYQRGFI